MAMDERARSCLLRSRSRLEQDIKAAYLMDHMISDGVLSGDEEDGIRRKPAHQKGAGSIFVGLALEEGQPYLHLFLQRPGQGELWHSASPLPPQVVGAVKLLVDLEGFKSF